MKTTDSNTHFIAKASSIFMKIKNLKTKLDSDQGLIRLKHGFELFLIETTIFDLFLIKILKNF